MVDFTISTSIQQGSLSTRASQSHKGGATNVNPANYDLRYIMEVWTRGTTPQLAYRGYRIVTDNFATTDVTFAVRLLAQEYDFVFWADFVPVPLNALPLPQDAPRGDHFYTTSNGLTNIEMRAIAISNDARDAYFAYVRGVDLSTISHVSGVTLTRPFGKLRLIATEVPDGRLTVDNVTICYALGAPTTYIPRTFNALTGETGNDYLPLAQLTQLTSTASPENAVVGGVIHNNAMVLAFDYIFAPHPQTQAQQTIISFSATAINNGQKAAQRDLSNIPIVRNKLTTIIGNFFTNMAVMNVIVSDPFDDEEIINADGTEISENITGTYTLLIPNIGSEQTFVFTGNIGNSATIIVKEDPASPGFDGTVNIAIVNATNGTVDINLPNASVNFLGNVGTLNVISNNNTFTQIAGSGIGTLNINGGNAILYGRADNLNANAVGTITADFDKVGTVTNIGNAKFFWRVATADHLRAVLALRENNNGVILTANIYGIAAPDGATGIAAQSALAIGDFADGTTANIDKTVMQGYIFDGGGFTISGTNPRGYLNQLLMIYADDVRVRNVTIANSPRSGIGLFNSTGVVLDSVTTINNVGAGIVVNGGEIAVLRNFTSSGNGWGGINLGRGTDPGLGIPTITLFEDSTIDIQDANPIWADFAGASATTFSHAGWYWFEHIIGRNPNVFRWRPGSGTTNVIVAGTQFFNVTNQATAQAWFNATTGNNSADVTWIPTPAGMQIVFNTTAGNQLRHTLTGSGVLSDAGAAAQFPDGFALEVTTHLTPSSRVGYWMAMAGYNVGVTLAPNGTTVEFRGGGVPEARHFSAVSGDLRIIYSVTEGPETGNGYETRPLFRVQIYDSNNARVVNDYAVYNNRIFRRADGTINGAIVRPHQFFFENVNEGSTIILKGMTVTAL